MCYSETEEEISLVMDERLYAKHFQSQQLQGTTHARARLMHTRAPQRHVRMRGRAHVLMAGVHVLHDKWSLITVGDGPLGFGASLHAPAALLIH